MPLPASINTEHLTRTELWEQTLLILRNAILTGKIPPGTRLVEAELAHSLGVSRLPVHQAITRLEQEQLVVRHLNRGAYVSEFNAQEVRDIYAMRRLVECYAIREAARHYRPEDEPGLLRILKHLRHAVEGDDAVGAVEVDLAFHRHLCLIAGSRRLLNVWETLVAPFHALIIIFNTRQSPDTLRQVPEAHMRFVEALRKGDGDEGEREMLRQLERSECTVLAWCAELESERIKKAD